MKWIGQHIYDHISRFRDDVYLEDVSSGTIASGGNLGLDSNNKIVKQSDTGITDLHGAGVDGSNNQLLTDDGDGTVTSEANLTFDGSTFSIEADSNTTANGLFIDANALTTGSAINLDIDDALTASATKSLMLIDYDKAGDTASGQTSTTTGLDINMADTATDNVGTILMTGVGVTVDSADADGTVRQTGVSVICTDGDASFTRGYYSEVEDGGFDIFAVSSANTSDYATWQTTTNGATTIATTDASHALAHFEVAADGNITLDAAGDIALEPGSGLATLTGDLRIGTSGSTSNNWISLDAQDGGDTSGGGITFYETGTYSVSAPQYGAKIVYNEDDDEFAIGTMHNNTFMRQIYMPRGLDYAYFGDAIFVEGTTPTIALKDSSTTVANADVIGILYWTNADDGGTTARIQAVATENHASGANGGTKIEFKTTPNTTSAEVLALTIGQDQSLTIAGEMQVDGPTGVLIKDTTTSSATEGGNLVLASDDGAVMADNHRLGVIEFKGAEDTSNTLTTGARIQAIADATWSASENGASLEFYTTDGNASESVALTLDSNNLATFAGNIAVGQIEAGGAEELIVHADQLVLGTAGNTIATSISTIVNTGTTAGKALTISAGSSTTGANNINGGNLTLAAGGGDGTGTSQIDFRTKVSGTDVATHRMGINSRGKVVVGGDGLHEPYAPFEVVYDFVNPTFENQFDDSQGGGEVLVYGSAQAGDPGTLHFLHTDGSWNATDADAVATGASQMLGIALGNEPGETGGPGGMLIKGFFKVASSFVEGTAAIGAPVYVSEVAGKFDFTAPSGSGDFVRIIGYCVDIDSSDILLHFDPDKTWVEVA